jgi:hypothetical protein
MAALILSNSALNSLSAPSQPPRLRTCPPPHALPHHTTTRGSWKGVVRAAKKGDNDKPSFSLGDQLLDYIEGAPIIS